MNNNPLEWTYTTWLLGLCMAIGGGLVNWFSRKKCDNHVFCLFELIGELFTAGLVGIGVFMISQSINQEIGISAAAAGIGGHMATRLLLLVERMITGKLEHHE